MSTLNKEIIIIIIIIIYIPEQFSLFDTNTDVLTGLVISLFLAAPAPRVRDLMGASVRNGLRFFLLFGKMYFFIQKSSFFINNLFRNVFQTLRVTGLITLVYAKLRCSKVFKLFEKVFFSLTVHRKPSFHNFQVISMF